jgi:hypothetical protein
MFKLYKDYKKYKKLADKVYKVSGLIAVYRYVKNTARYYPRSTHVPSCLASSFIWSSTPEGFDYWTNIDYKVWSLK